MPVMSILFNSPSQTMDKSVVYVVLNNTEYSIVPLVNLSQTSNVLHYHKPHGTTNMSIPLLSVILLKMTTMNITVIFVKKNETQNIGSTTVKIVVILLIPNVFLGNTQISFIEKLKTTLICNSSCEIQRYQCALCNFYMHR